MAQVRAVVLRAAGINCDMETEYALQLAGAKAERVHINRLIENKSTLDQYQIIVFPGGFSYGDDVAAGKILANQVVHHLYEPVQKFIEDGKLVLGICNGFQSLVKAGILPGFETDLATEDTENTEKFKIFIATEDTESTEVKEKNKASKITGQTVTITYNDSGKFEDRWVYLAPQTDRCIFIEKGRQIYLPVAHGEGKVVTKNAKVLEQLKGEGYVAFNYVDENGKEGDYPINPNGSVDSIAGLTDATGRVLGLMPHPERFVRLTQHPHWPRLKKRQDGDGMTIFNNAVRYIQQNV
jgi:phosphoribosylformylglycinamidine synthase